MISAGKFYSCKNRSRLYTLILYYTIILDARSQAESSHVRNIVNLPLDSSNLETLIVKLKNTLNNWMSKIHCSNQLEN